MVKVSTSWHLRMAVIMKASDVEHDSHEYHISVRWRLHPQTATSIKVISCLLLHIVSSRGSLPVAVGETAHENNYSFLKLAFILAVIVSIWNTMLDVKRYACLPYFWTHLCADGHDYAPDDNLSDVQQGLQKCLTSLQSWCEINRLKLNNGKTRVILIGNNALPNSLYINYILIMMTHP